jgi:hypothetical protein
MKTTIERIFETLSKEKVELKSQKIELALVDDLKVKLDTLKKGEELATEVFAMHNKAVKEAATFAKRLIKIQGEVASLGADIQVKTEELGLDTPKIVQEADKLLGKSEQTWSKLIKISKS